MRVTSCLRRSFRWLCENAVGDIATFVIPFEDLGGLLRRLLRAEGIHGAQRVVAAEAGIGSREDTVAGLHHRAHPGVKSSAICSIGATTSQRLFCRSSLRRTSTHAAHFNKVTHVLGMRLCGTGATLATRQTLADLGVLDVTLLNGAGLHRDQRVTADQMVQAAEVLAREPDLREAVLPLLPIEGRQGRMTQRTIMSAAASRVAAKTGALDGGRCDHRLCFAGIGSRSRALARMRFRRARWRFR